MNKVIGWGIAAFGGYFVLKAMGYDVLSMLPSATVNGTATSPQANNPTSAASGQLITAIFNKIVANKVDPNSYQTVDVWNTFYVMVKNTPGPSPEELFPTQDRNTTMTFGQYAAGLTAKGMSGLGMIAHWVNPYSNVQGTPMGSNLLANGAEKFVVRKGY